MLRNHLIFWLILVKPGDFIQDDWLEAEVVFISETTVFVASSFKTMRLFVPFPELPRINVTQLQLARHSLAHDVTQQWDGNCKGRICSSTVVTESFGNMTASAVFELESEYQQLQQDYQLFKERMSLSSNQSNVVHEETRQKRQANVLLAAGAALIPGPKLEAVGCKLVSIFGLCKSKEARHIEKLHGENQRKK